MSLATDEAAKGALNFGGNGDRHTSIPDPSTATTQMMLREIGSLMQLIEANKTARDNEIAGMRDLLLTRIVAVEKGIELAHENEQRWPTTMDREITAVKQYFGVLLDTHNEKFISVNRRFEERDVRHADGGKDNKRAIDDAFKAASEAVKMQQDASDKAITKSETAFTKQIEGAQSALAAAKQDMDKRMDDAKERTNGLSQLITAMQSAQIGRKEQTVEKNDSTTLVYGAIGVLVGLGGLVAAFLARTAS